MECYVSYNIISLLPHKSAFNVFEWKKIGQSDYGREGKLMGNETLT